MTLTPDDLQALTVLGVWIFAITCAVSVLGPLLSWLARRR